MNLKYDRRDLSTCESGRADGIIHKRKVFSQDTITDWRNAGGAVADSGDLYFAIHDDPAGGKYKIQY